MVLYTSGTTGRPKGAELRHHNVYDNALAGVDLFASDPERPDTYLCALPLFHVFGQTVIHDGALAFGGTIVMQPRFEAPTTLRLMLAHDVTFFAGVPTTYGGLLSALDGTVDVARLAANLRVAAAVVPCWRRIQPTTPPSCGSRSVGCCSPVTSCSTGGRRSWSRDPSPARSACWRTSSPRSARTSSFPATVRSAALNSSRTSSTTCASSRRPPERVGVGTVPAAGRVRSRPRTVRRTHRSRTGRPGRCRRRAGRHGHVQRRPSADVPRLIQAGLQEDPVSVIITGAPPARSPPKRTIRRCPPSMGDVDGSRPEAGACSQPGGDFTGSEGGVIRGALHDDANRAVALGVADVQ